RGRPWRQRRAGGRGVRRRRRPGPLRKPRRPLPHGLPGGGRAAAAGLRHLRRGGALGPEVRRRMIEPLPDLIVRPVIRSALAEDLGRAGDVTAQAFIPADATLTADFVTRRGGVVAGLDCVRLTLAELDAASSFTALSADGQAVPAGVTLA